MSKKKKVLNLYPSLTIENAGSEGKCIARQEGKELLALVEGVRLSVREGQQDEILNKLTDSQTISLVRAFSNFFNLSNI
jgi:phosphoenolpyruvate carboxylase